MNLVIMIKYGELNTKKNNRNFFIGLLYRDLDEKLLNYNVKIRKDLARMYIEFDIKDKEEILKVINKTFGIHKYVLAYKISKDIETIEKTLLSIIKDKSFSTFKVETKRSDKTFPVSSLEFSRQMGGLILKNTKDKKVNVTNPELLVSIEIRNEYVYIYTDSYNGLGGYPLNSMGKGLVMLSGGIDSPVAAYLSMRRGINAEMLYFEALPHTSLDARKKVITLTRKLAAYTKEIKLHIVPFTDIQEAIYQNMSKDYMITIMRRMMYRIADKYAKRRKCQVLINGESIGQVASQTLRSMSVINEVTNMPVIRPVACMDKLDIIKIAEEIDTYNTSILPFEDCCTIFVPEHPVIHPYLSECLEEEKKIDYETKIDETISKIETITITEKEEDNFEYLL